MTRLKPGAAHGDAECLLRLIHVLLLAAACLVGTAQARGAPSPRDITPDFTVLHATVGKYSAQDFFSDRPPQGFVPLHPPANIARPGDEAWLRATLPPYSARTSADILEIPGQIFNFIDVWYRLPDGRVVHHRAGDHYPYVERSVRHAPVAFPIPRVQDGSVDVLIRAHNITSHSMNFAAWVWPAAQWDSYLMLKRLWYGVFLGAIIALSIYNLFLAVTLRDTSYLYYVGYILCLSFCVILLSGLAEEYLWPHGKPAPFVLAMTGAGTFLGIGFANRFLRIKQTSPAMYRVTTGIGLLAMVMGVYLIFWPRLPFIPQAYSARAIHLLLLSGAVYFIVVSLASYFRGVTHARFLALSMAVLLTSVSVYFSYTYGFVRYNPFIGHALEFGSLAEGMLLSLALADRINLLTREKQEAEHTALEYHRNFSRGLIRAQERERQALAETMHDSIGHGLLVLRNNLKHCAESARASAVGESVDLARHLREQVDYCGEIMDEVRRVSHDLHPHMLARLGLAAAVEAMLARALEPLGVQWSVEIDELCRDLDPDLQAIVYRTVQECLNNIMKYARATRVSCELVRDRDTVKGCVYDNGVGFDVATLRKQTVGLEEMAGRLQVVGGSLVIDSVSGEGTTLAFEVPLTLSRQRVGVLA
jgi:signal transduction histidine kinase